MSWRINRARFLLRLGNFLQSLPVVTMKPDELIEFGRQTYFRSGNVQAWLDDNLVDSGLNKAEVALINAIPLKTGNLLLLGVGGGREAITFTKMGFSVTGVDFIKDMVSGAMENAKKRGVEIHGLVQEISNLAVPDNFYNVVWISKAMYSCIPTRKRRIELVRRIERALIPGGFFICQFHLDPKIIPTRRGVILRRIIAALTFGNYHYEPGDMLWLNVEFLHSFQSKSDVKSELEEVGLEILKHDFDELAQHPAVISMKIC